MYWIAVSYTHLLFWYAVTHFVLRNAVCTEVDQLAQLFLGHAAVLADALDFLSDVHFVHSLCRIFLIVPHHNIKAQEKSNNFAKTIDIRINA